MDERPVKKVIITGATSGIGRELAIQLAHKGYKVGLTGRRTVNLEALKKEIGERAFIKTLDVTDLKKAELVYNQLITEMGGLDIMILNAGVGNNKVLPSWESEENIIKINALAFAHGCHFAFQWFQKQGHGQIVGVSSVTAFVSSYRAAAYSATKHFVRSYLTGYRQKCKRISANITVTEIIPGFVRSEMTAKNKSMFWVSSTKKAVAQMITAIERKKNHVYITRRWRFIVWILNFVPQWVWNRI